MTHKLPEIIGIVGPIRAGKTTAANHLVEHYGYVQASNSEILKRILIEMGIAPHRANLALVGDALFKVLGNDLIAKYRLENIHLGRIIVDGIRYSDELTRYSASPTFKLLGVTADSEVRFERTLQSADKIKDPNISRIEFDQLAKARSEISVPELLLKADATIHNTGSVDLFKYSLDDILKVWSSQENSF